MFAIKKTNNIQFFAKVTFRNRWTKWEIMFRALWQFHWKI